MQSALSIRDNGGPSIFRREWCQPTQGEGGGISGAVGEEVAWGENSYTL